MGLSRAVTLRNTAKELAFHQINNKTWIIHVVIHYCPSEGCRISMSLQKSA